MDNTQVLSIVLAAVPTMLAVLLGILVNNSTLSDTHARIADSIPAPACAPAPIFS